MMTTDTGSNTATAMNFPLQLRFKVMALAPQIYVTDAAKNEVFYVKQKMFKLRDAISVFSDHNQTQQVASIQADRMVDFSASFQITDAAGTALGGIRRQGMRSLWKVSFQLLDAGGQVDGTIAEENPFAKIMDAMFAKIPFVGVFAAYVFQPKYLLKDAAGTPILRLVKRGSLMDRRFEVVELAPAALERTTRNVLALLMLVLLERHRE